VSTPLVLVVLLRGYLRPGSECTCFARSSMAYSRDFNLEDVENIQESRCSNDSEQNLSLAELMIG